MFNAPCCATCVHGHLSHGDEPRARDLQHWSCRRHRKWLPEWLDAWKHGLVLCQAWRHHNDRTPGDPPPDWLKQRLPDPGLLYGYKDEYTPGLAKVIEIAALPDLQPPG